MGEEETTRGGKKSGRRGVRSVCLHGHPRSIHMHDDGDVSYLIRVAVLIEQQQRSSMLISHRRLQYTVAAFCDKCPDDRSNAPFAYLSYACLR